MQVHSPAAQCPASSLLRALVTRPCSACAAPTQSFGFLPPDQVVCTACCAPSPPVHVSPTRADRYERRLEQTGLASQKRIIQVLGISRDHLRVPLLAEGRSYAPACAAARNYMQLGDAGLLVLAGTSGAGKSTAGGWAAWRSGGRFLVRSEWSSVKVRAPDESQVQWLTHHRGVLVFDDAFVVRPGGVPGDSDWESEVVFQIATGRHEGNRATIITTQASIEEVRSAYGTRGEAIARRAQASGGWVHCG